jgi:succinyldiaminopimelate transaminase
MVAWLAYFLGVERVLIPKIAYPTYKVGALLARAQCIEVDIDARAWPKSDEKTLIWINTPSNPTGRVQSDLELREVLKHRDSGAIIASDECYFPFGDGDRPRSILDLAQGKNENLLSLHSLSKRSNLAGYRAAFIAGDKKLINELLQLRKHAGMMVSAPVQKAMAAALAEETHVEMQSQRYRARRAKLAPALASLGFSIEFSRAGLYIWCSNGDRDWDQVAWFSQRGIVVTPGSFYGEDGNRHIRIALTASDADIERTVDRISTT